MFLHIIARQQAKSLGMNRYFTGIACKRGHISERKICGSCLACKRTPEAYAKSKNLIAEFFSKNPGRRKQYQDKYYAKPESKLADMQKRKRYRALKGASVLANQRLYRSKKYSDSPEYKMAAKCRIMIRRLMFCKRSSTFESIGYTPALLVARIECQFKLGMTWENHGDWEIDHKKPVARFIAQGVKNPAIINALANLQPLWKQENRAKGDSFWKDCDDLNHKARGVLPGLHGDRECQSGLSYGLRRLGNENGNREPVSQGIA